MRDVILVLLVFTFTSRFVNSAADLTKFKEVLLNQSSNATFVALFEERIKRIRKIESQTQRDFPCKPYPVPERNITVHTLSPSDIKVVGALGDSITVGFGVNATTVPELFNSYRGLSFNVGGDRNINEHVTIPNIIKLYNPDVRGYSIGKALSTDWNSHLNVAVLAENSYGMPRQAKLLIRKMRNRFEKIDFYNDWKIITILIGINGVCHSCQVLDYYSPDNYRKNMQATLDILHRKVPKAYVNVILVPHTDEGKHFHGDEVCDVLSTAWCPCGVSEPTTRHMNRVKLLYDQVLIELVNSGRYDTRDDFTVVVQPFISHIKIPKLPDGSDDLSYLTVDCYHPNLFGHRMSAEALWNNMLEPEGQKTAEIKITQKVKCPSAAQPYFYTRLNSPSVKLSRSHSEELIIHKTAPLPTNENASSALSKFGISASVFAAVSILGITLYRVFKGRRIDSRETENLL